jgi:Ala-tRNA(Pro) deacylase
MYLAGRREQTKHRKIEEITSTMDIYQFLADHQIECEQFEHPPVYTIADVQRLKPDLPGAQTKNLFMRDKKGNRHFLVVVPGDKRVDMKSLPAVLESTKVSFGSPNRLKQHLGIEPGAVSLLAVFNDRDRHAVEIFIDATLWTSAALQFHPLINTCTLVVSKDGIERFLAATGHKARIVDVPSP